MTAAQSSGQTPRGIRVTVTRVDPNLYGGAVTFRIPGYDAKFTVSADTLAEITADE